MVARYGMIREVESDLVNRIVALCKENFNEVRFLEIGVCHGGTSAGVVRRCKEIDCPVTTSGVECFHDRKPDLDHYPELRDYHFYEGDSMDIWCQIKDTFNFLFIDGCHCVNHSMCDFLNYSPFVVVGGYCLFHDTGTAKGAIEQGEWPQDHSYAGRPNSVLGVCDGLKKLGLLQDYRRDWKLIEEIPSGEDGLMGMMLFQKMFEL